MKEKFISSENGIVYYWIQKNKNPKAGTIIFTHGLTANHSSFEFQIEHFLKDYTVITWDLPLHGKSRPYRNFSYQAAASDLKEILHQEKIDSAILVGHSLGGYVSQKFYLLYPEMVDAFIGMSTTPFGSIFYSIFDKFWITNAGAIYESHLNKYFQNFIAMTSSDTEYSYQQMLDMQSIYSRDELISMLDAVYGDFFTETRPVTFCCPVLLLVGESDRTGNIQLYNKLWHRHQGYPLEFIPDAAHLVTTDNSKEVNGRIDYFLKSIEQ